jgi:hypothetical protein
MSNYASCAGVTTHGAALALAALAGVVACSSCKGSAAPPARLAASAPAPTSVPNPVEFRSSGGMPIVPVVIADDPAPALLPSAGVQPSAPSSTMNGDPKGLTREALNRALQGVVASVASCFSPSTPDPMVTVSFEADPSGRPSLVRLKGAPADAEHCIRNVVQDIHFSSFEGKGVQVDFPVTFHRVVRNTQSGGPSGQEQATSAPQLFMLP